MKIVFYWQGISEHFDRWNDGLKAAMRLIEKEHEVIYLEPWVNAPEGTDVILYWEAMCTFAGKDRESYYNVQRQPYPKALLFAGGPVQLQWAGGFNLFFVESEINEKEFEELGLPWKRAFGVNTDVFKPQKQPKVFDGMHQGTCASWKRQGLFSRALREKGIVCGRHQETDPAPFRNCVENGTLVLPELPYPAVASLLNASHAIVNTCEYWGGGQRATLEGMACGIPAIVMSDSPKNREYVEESGAGLVVDPDEEQIRKAVAQVKAWTPEEKARGVAYVQSKWTHHHYAKNLLEGIKQII